MKKENSAEGGNPSKLNKAPETAFPANVLVLNTHGSYEIPSSLRQFLSPVMKRQDRLLRNGSDYGVTSVLKKIPEDQKVEARFSRFIGDPNRSPESKDCFRATDFYGNPVWSEPFQAWIKKPFWQKRLLKMSYEPYYEEIFKRLEFLMEDPKNQDQKVIYILDHHDTGHKMLASKRRYDHNRMEAKNTKHKVDRFEMPAMIISDQEHQTADQEMTCFLRNNFAQAFKKEGLAKESDIKLNHHFKGGFVTRLFGGLEPKSAYHKRLLDLEKKYGKKVQSLQIEFDRGLYMVETAQKTKPDQIKKMAHLLSEVICQTFTSKRLVSIQS